MFTGMQHILTYSHSIDCPDVYRIIHSLAKSSFTRSTTKPHCNSKKSSHSLITVQKISYIIISVLKRRRRFPALPYSLVIVISFKSLRNCADKFLCSFWVMVVYDLVDCHLFSFLARFLRDESLSVKEMIFLYSN